jgi:deazaflavin-dependent oxidoreductase (nitroreductase family)
VAPLRSLPLSIDPKERRPIGHSCPRIRTHDVSGFPRTRRGETPAQAEGQGPLAGRVGVSAHRRRGGFTVRDETVRIGRGFGSVTLSPMPSDFALKAMNRVHRILLGVSGGRFGWHFSGMPVIELTTTGRKSGQSRTTMLTSPYQEDSAIVVVASRGGDDTNPAWFLNLRDDPNVMVKLGPKPAESMVAEIADANERARIWPIIASKHTNYAGYQRKTDRQIPLVLLRPAGG